MRLSRTTSAAVAVALSSTLSLGAVGTALAATTDQGPAPRAAAPVPGEAAQVERLARQAKLLNGTARALTPVSDLLKQVVGRPGRTLSPAEADRHSAAVAKGLAALRQATPRTASRGERSPHPAELADRAGVDLQAKVKELLKVVTRGTGQTPGQGTDQPQGQAPDQIHGQGRDQTPQDGDHAPEQGWGQVPGQDKHHPQDHASGQDEEQEEFPGEEQSPAEGQEQGQELSPEQGTDQAPAQGRDQAPVQEQGQSPARPKVASLLDPVLQHLLPRKSGRQEMREPGGQETQQRAMHVSPAQQKRVATAAHRTVKATVNLLVTAAQSGVLPAADLKGLPKAARTSTSAGPVIRPVNASDLPREPRARDFRMLAQQAELLGDTSSVLRPVAGVVDRVLKSPRTKLSRTQAAQHGQSLRKALAELRRNAPKTVQQPQTGSSSSGERAPDPAVLALRAGNGLQNAVDTLLASASKGDRKKVLASADRAMTATSNVLASVTHGGSLPAADLRGLSRQAKIPRVAGFPVAHLR